jgi:uncharacterized protein YbjT (DUF2867 family)
MATRSPFTTVAEPIILVFGLTGALGGHVLEGLIAPRVAPATVTAAGRNPNRLAELGKSGFATAKLTYRTRPASLTSSLDTAGSS